MPEWIGAIEYDLPAMTREKVVDDEIQGLIDLTVDLHEGEEYTQADLLDEFDATTVYHLTHEPGSNYDVEDETILTSDRQLLSTVLHHNDLMRHRERNLGFWGSIFGASALGSVYSLAQLAATGDMYYLLPGSISTGAVFYSGGKIVNTLYSRHLAEEQAEKELLKNHSHQDHYTLELKEWNGIADFYEDITREA